MSCYLVNLYALVQCRVFKVAGTVETTTKLGVHINTVKFLQGFDKSALVVRRAVSAVSGTSRVFNWRSRFVLKFIPGSIGLTIRVTKNNIFIVVYTMAGKNLF